MVINTGLPGNIPSIPVVLMRITQHGQAEKPAIHRTETYNLQTPSGQETFIEALGKYFNDPRVGQIVIER